MSSQNLTVPTAAGDRNLLIPGDATADQIEQIKADVQSKFGAPVEKSFLEKAKNAVVEFGPNAAKRIGPAIAGQVIGNLAAGPIGGMALGAGGAGLGSWWAQQDAINKGTQKDTNLKELSLDAAMGAFPGIPLASEIGLPAKLAIRGLEGAGLSGIGNAASTKLNQDRWPTLPETLKASGVGAALGTGMGAIAHPIETSLAGLPEKLNFFAPEQSAGLRAAGPHNPTVQSDIPAPQVQGELFPQSQETPQLPQKLEYPTAKTPLSGGVSYKEQMDNAWNNAQVAKTQVQDRGGSAQEAEKALSDAYIKNIRAAGIPDAVVLTNPMTGQRDTKYKPSNWKDAMYVYNQVQEQVGEPLGQQFNQNLEARYKYQRQLQDVNNNFNDQAPRANIKKQGLSAADTTYLMKYMRTDPQGNVVFDPSALQIPGKIDYAAFDPTQINGGSAKVAKVLPDLIQLRKNMDGLQQFAKAQGVDVEYLPGYVPNRSKVPGATGSTANTVQNPFMTQERISGKTNSLTENDYFKLSDSYKKALVRQMAFNKPLSNSLEVAKRLRIRGGDVLAKDFEEHTAQMFGFKDPRELIHYQIDEQTRPFFEALVTNEKQDPGTVHQLIQAVKNVGTKAWIGMNPHLQVMAAAQPEQIGPAIIGMPAVEKGRIMRATGTKVPNELESRMWGTRVGKMDTGENVPVTNKAINFGEKVLSFPLLGKLSSGTMDMTDKEARRTVFLGASGQFKRDPEAAFGRLLLDSDRQAVREALQTGGVNKAANEYAIAQVRQTMDIMDSMGKSKKLRTGAGTEIPFTRFFSSRANRITENFRQGNKLPAVKEAMRSSALSILIGSGVLLTGGSTEDAKNAAISANPLSSLPGMLKMSVAPQLGDIQQAIQQKGIGAGISKWYTTSTPLGKLTSGIGKMLEGKKKVINE